MRGSSAGLVMALTLLGNACSHSRAPLLALPCAASDSAGAVRVSLSESSRGPVADANVHGGPLIWATSDDLGRACVTDIEPGVAHLQVDRIGFRAESLAVHVQAGAVTDVAVTLDRAAPPCCRLEGSWKVHFDMEKPFELYDHPAARSVEGIVVFNSRLPSQTRWSSAFSDSIVRYEYAHTTVDFSPFFGGRAARDVSTTIFGPGGETLVREVTGIIPTGDSVDLTFIPRMSHGSIWLHGRLAHDTIRGSWVQSAYCCGAEGKFEMHRIPQSPEADSLVASGLRAYTELERAARAADSARQRRIGWVRLRVYDEAPRHYIAASFWMIRNAHDPVRFEASPVSAADTGWGNYQDMEPGEYYTILFDFACGHQTYFADSTYAKKHGLAFAVTVRSGERVEREVRLDSRRVEATSSYENPDAKLCDAEQHSSRSNR